MTSRFQMHKLKFGIAIPKVSIHTDPTGEQTPFNMRRTYYDGSHRQVCVQTILPSELWLPPDS